MSRMDGRPERRRTTLRGAGASGGGGVAQDALSNLLFGRHAWVSILPRGAGLGARSVGRGVGLLVRARWTDATLGRAREGRALLLENGRGGRQRRVVLEDVGPGGFLSWQRHLGRFDRGMLQMAGWVNLSLMQTTDDGGVRMDQFRHAAKRVSAGLVSIVVTWL